MTVYLDLMAMIQCVANQEMISLEGDLGDDTYIFAIGDGSDTINDSDGGTK